MNRLHLQLALDTESLDEAEALARRALPWVDTMEVGTPLLLCAGMAALSRVRALLGDDGPRLLADTKISDEGARIAQLCFDHGASAVSVVDGASTATLREVRELADARGCQVWVDLLHHSNPIIRAQAVAPYVDGFILYRPPAGLPPLLVEGLLSLDRPFRMAGGIDLPMAEHLMRPRPDELLLEGIIVGRAITQADDVDGTLRDFARVVGRPAPQGASL